MDTAAPYFFCLPCALMTVSWTVGLSYPPNRGKAALAPGWGAGDPVVTGDL